MKQQQYNMEKSKQQRFPDTRQLTRASSLHQNTGNKKNSAVLKLKQAENDLDLMRRRLSALQIKQEKNNKKSEVALKRFKFHLMVQQLEQRQKEQIQIHRQDLSNRMQKQRFLNSSQRHQRTQQLAAAKQEIKMIKSQSFQQEKKASNQIAERLKQLNQSEAQSRREIRSKVRQFEEQSRKSYQLFHLQRKNAIKSHRQIQQSRVIDLQERRQVEMRQLARLQIQMLERQSKSRQTAEENLTQLAILIGPKRGKRKLSNSGITHSSFSNPEEGE